MVKATQSALWTALREITMPTAPLTAKIAVIQKTTDSPFTMNPPLRIHL